MSLLTDPRNLELLARYERAWPKPVDRAYTERSSRVELAIADEIFPLVLLDHAAPAMCAAFTTRLPVEGLFIHAAWSGDAIRGLDDFDLPGVTEPENATYYPVAGDLVYTLGHRELSLIYGDCLPSMPSGRVRECVVAVVPSRIHDLQRVGRLVRLTGAKTFRISRRG